MGDDRLALARELYDRAMFHGDAGALTAAERELDALEAGLALARGRVLHVRFLESRVEDPAELELFERAAGLFRGVGDVVGEAEALFWLGTFHQVVRDDDATAVPFLERSYELAKQAGDRLTLSYATRHLGFAHGAAGRTDLAREHLLESVALRQELGFTAGVAAGQLALADYHHRTGDPVAAQRMLEEARVSAEQVEAHGVLAWIEDARARFTTV